KRGRAALKANARRFAANVRPIIAEIIRSGITSHNAIAAKLNERNVRTARGGTWTHVQVGAILGPFDGASTAAAVCSAKPLVLLYYKPLRSITNALEFSYKSVVQLNRLFDRNIVGLTKANGLKQLAPNLLH